MYSISDFTTMIKEMNLNAVESTSPMEVLYGKVVGVNPLKIMINQKLTLGQRQLILTRNVIDYEVNITVRNLEEEESVHNEKEQSAFKIYNGLQLGEVVILISDKGGQKFIVLDKVVI